MRSTHLVSNYTNFFVLFVHELWIISESISYLRMTYLSYFEFEPMHYDFL